MASRELRSDAAANRDRIVEAARAELSKSNGAYAELRLHRVAKSAGVAQGTLYRHFPTREHLLAEVYRQELTQLADAVAPLLAEHPPLRALTCWLQRLVEYARVKRGVMAAIEASAWRDLYSGQHHRLGEALGALLDRGKAVGLVREEVDAADVIFLLGALSRIPQPEWDTRAHTIVAVIADGLRPVESTACTGDVTFPRFSGVGLLDDQPSSNPVEAEVPKAYAPEFRRKVLDLVASGRPVAQVAHDLEISAQAIYAWRRQQLIDSGQVPGLTSSDHAELVAARKRIAELEAELAIHRKAAELLGDVVPPKDATGRSR